MKKVSEKRNTRSMGGLMKIRFLAVVLGTIAIMTSGVAVAQTASGTAGGAAGTGGNLSLNIPINVKGFEMDFSKFFKQNDSSDDTSSTGVSAWKCLVEERDNWDKANDSLDTVVTGLLSWKALANSHQRDILQYKYMGDVAQYNNTWRMMDSALYYSTQQQLAYYQYRYGSTYSNYGGSNYNQGIKNVASDKYNTYSDDWYSTWGG